MKTIKRAILAAAVAATLAGGLAGGSAYAAVTAPAETAETAKWTCTTSKDQWGFVNVSCVYTMEPAPSIPPKPGPKPPTLPATQ